MIFIIVLAAVVALGKLYSVIYSAKQGIIIPTNSTSTVSPAVIRTTSSSPVGSAGLP